jgi:hypothetical protein
MFHGSEACGFPTHDSAPLGILISPLRSPGASHLQVHNQSKSIFKLEMNRFILFRLALPADFVEKAGSRLSVVTEFNELSTVSAKTPKKMP